MVKLVNLNHEVQKKGNAEAYHVLSDIINEEIKQTSWRVDEYYPGELALFSFYRNYINVAGKFSFLKNWANKISAWILFWTGSEPVFIDGGPPYPHIKVRNKSYLNFAERIAKAYKERSGIDMTIEYAS